MELRLLREPGGGGTPAVNQRGGGVAYSRHEEAASDRASEFVCPPLPICLRALPDMTKVGLMRMHSSQAPSLPSHTRCLLLNHRLEQFYLRGGESLRNKGPAITAIG